MSHVLAVSGSPSSVSRSAILLGHVTSILGEHGHSVDTVSLRDLPAEPLMHAQFDDPSVLDCTARLAAADAVVVATPVYKSAYSGLLKTWLDVMPQLGLEGKSVLPLATGGSVAHALALDYALRPVLTSMGARHVVNGFLVLDRFIESPTTAGPVNINEEARPALVKVLDGFLDTLSASELQPI